MSGSTIGGGTSTSTIGGLPITISSTTNATATSTSALLSAISGAVSNGSASTFTAGSGSPPPLAPGRTGVVLETIPGGGSVVLSGGYNTAVIGSTSPVAVLATNPGNTVVAGTGGLAYAGSGGGSVVAGGGDNLIVNYGYTTAVGANGQVAAIPAPFSVTLGDGNDSIGVVGGVNTVNAGGGHNLIVTEGGLTTITSTGADTIDAGWLNAGGAVAIDGSQNVHGDTVNGGNALIGFVGGSGSNSVLAGAGSATLYGGSGTNFLAGGALGNNSIEGGTGRSTLIGGGSGDQLVMQGDQAQQAVAGAGNELLFGSTGSGHDIFTFQKGFTGAGVTDAIGNFNTANDTIDIKGYGANGYTLASGSTSTITLSDGTRITVLANITNANITTS